MVFHYAGSFCAGGRRELSKENFFYNWERDEDPDPGREMHAEEKMNLKCGGCIAF